MSDTQTHPNYWQASDGKWYPPVPVTETWEHVVIERSSNNSSTLVANMNDAGAKGWELITITNNDRMVGVNSLVAIMRRKIVPFPPPDDLSPEWKTDPSGRHKGRHWDGANWTFKVMDDGDETRDPPTQLKPASLPQ